MTAPSEADDRSSVAVDRVRSRERAVSRGFRGVVTAGVGWLGVMAVPVADAVLGAGQTLQEVWSIGARSLVWIGVLVAASAGTHLLRYGGRRGAMAFASFAAAGACGLVAVAEQFETWFLDSSLLRGLDTWALAGAIFFIILGALLLGGEEGGDRAEEKVAG
jgi:hypothetical protein